MADSTGPGAAFDVLTMGRIGVDLYPAEPGPLATVRSFHRSLGGTATNVAVAAARLGNRSAIITRVGRDPFGDYVRTALAGFGVDPAFVGTDPALPTPITFCALDPPEDPPLLFYRHPTAPDMNLHTDDLPGEAIETARIFWTIGSAFSAEPSRTTTVTAIARRNRRDVTVLDLDFRPMFWADPADATAQLRHAIPLVSVVVGNRAEMRVATGHDDPRAAVDALLARGVGLAVVKLGGDGVLVASPGECVQVPPQRVEVVCGLGAGDAFGGALCHGLLAGWDPERIGRFANAAGAIVAGRLACADAMPTRDEVEELAGSSHAH